MPRPAVVSLGMVVLILNAQSPTWEQLMASGEAQMVKGQYAEAENAFRRSLEIAEASRGPTQVARSLHQPERTHKNAQYRAHVSHHILLERALVGCYMERLERLGRPLRFRPDLPNTRQISIRQRNRNPRPEPCDTGIAVLFRNSALGKAPRQDDVWREVNQSKVSWHHSDHLVWNEIDHHRAAQHLAMSAELPLPICVAKDHRLRGPRGVVFA